MGIMNIRLMGLAAMAMTCIGTAKADNTVFEGRAANGAVDLTCTSHGGAGKTKCVMFYDTALNITILNNWATAPAAWNDAPKPGESSIQRNVAEAGFAATGLTGWVLPTRQEMQSIWGDVGRSYSEYMGLSTQFDGVWSGFYYWTRTSEGMSDAEGRQVAFSSQFGAEHLLAAGNELSGVASRPGDVALAVAVPEPQTYALMLAGLGLIAGIARRRSKQQ
jgi:hypothetical protein